VQLKSATLKLKAVTVDQNDFLEFLRLEGGEPHLVTKSELLSMIREEGLTITDRQLTFYVTEGLIPRSVRVGSRAGVYPRLVVELLSWVLRAREMGVPIEAIKELVPVWKFLAGARKEHLLDLAQFEDVARQKLSSLEAALAVPELVTRAFICVCKDCRGEITVLAKDGTKHRLDDPATMIGFAAIWQRTDDSGASKFDWFGYRRINLASPPDDFAADPTTVILGIPPDVALPPSPKQTAHEDPSEGLTQEAATEPPSSNTSQTEKGSDG
jgi:DNA-binding transcriptional MerR regulator